MSFQHATFFVDGMTCSACEARVSKVLGALEGVSRAKVRLQGGTVTVEYDDGIIDLSAIKAAVVTTGYTVRESRGSGTAVSLGIGLLLVAAYLIAGSTGVFRSLPAVDSSIGYAMLFVIGLLTSIHCVAMCGGIALSQSVGLDGASAQATDPGAILAAKPAKARLAALTPGLLYNGGRVISYTIIGALVGALGSAFNFSPLTKGLIAGAAGLFMVVFGLRMLGLLKALPSLSNLFPAPLRNGWNGLTSKLRRGGPLAVGVLNGLIPCGPLQTMQLYALGTGSALAGALSMLIFSAGTVPLMLVFGLTATLLPRKFVPVMLKASAVLVMFLGVVTFARAATLAGMPLPFGDKATIVQVSDQKTLPAGTLVATVSDGVQSIVTEFTSSDYVPFAVQAGVPLKWTIRISADDLNGCNGTVVVPAYGIKKKLVPGDNLIEFTPKKEGTISYSCWMGMIKSQISVVGNQANPLLLPDQSATPGDSGQAGWLVTSGIPVDTIGFPVIKDGMQTITVTVSARGYSPAAIVLQKGMKAVIRFKVEELTSCNSLVDFPEFNGRLNLAKGQLETPPIPVTADFNFQCGMSMLHGYAKAVDDLSKVDVEKIKKEIGAIPVAAGCGGGCCGGQ